MISYGVMGSPAESISSDVTWQPYDIRPSGLGVNGRFTTASGRLDADALPPRPMEFQAGGNPLPTPRPRPAKPERGSRDGLSPCSPSLSGASGGHPASGGLHLEPDIARLTAVSSTMGTVSTGWQILAARARVGFGMADVFPLLYNSRVCGTGIALEERFFRPALFSRSSCILYLRGRR